MNLIRGYAGGLIYLMVKKIINLLNLIKGSPQLSQDY